jgi:hypothetical protein
VAVRVDPWAEIELDGRPRGVAPLTLEVPTGRHVLLLRNPDLGRRERVEVHVNRDENVAIERSWR